jgi:hypothetical protein
MKTATMSITLAPAYRSSTLIERCNEEIIYVKRKIKRKEMK